MAAAVVAATEGLNVVVFDKAKALGGTTATSGGAVWVPGNSAAQRAGKPDALEDARRLLRDEAGTYFRADLTDAYLASGAEALDYLALHTDIEFEPAAIPDYVSEKPGATLNGRALVPVPFDGAILGKNFCLVRPPRSAFMILGGLMIGRKEIPQFLHPLSSWAAFKQVTRLLVGYAKDRLRFSRGTRLLLGNALIARALHTALKRGVKFHTQAALVDLLQEGGRVTGATVRTSHGLITVQASTGVVLATGGIAHSARLRDAHAPQHPHHLSLASQENTGDAAEAAMRVGGAIDTELQSPGFWTPASISVDARGRETLYPYGHLDRGKPGAIIVNAAGRRFVNESDSYHHVVLAMFRTGAVAPLGKAFIVCDSDFIAKYGLGLVKPAPFPTRSHVRNGYLKRADNLAALAAQLGVDVTGLQDEVARHNRFAVSGHDDDFGKGDTAFNRYNGDPLVTPNPCLAPITRPPFHAIELFPCTIGMAAGLRTDANSRVLGKDGVPIGGLYACGNDMGSVTRGAYPGPGITIGPAIVFAYRAMLHAARENHIKTKETTT